MVNLKTCSCIGKPLKYITTADFTDLVKIGKLNYHPSDINWKKFGNDAESLCKELGLNYYSQLLGN